MPTKFRVFEGINGSSIEQDANAFMEEVESKGGKFVESRLSTLGPSGNELVGTATLVVVYEDASTERRLAKARSF